MFVSILRWWFSIEIISLIALPLAAVLFRHLPLRGYAFSKALGLLLLGYGSWLLAMLELVPFGMPAVLAALLLIAAASWWALKTADPGALLHELRDRWRAVLAYELLFAAALYVGLWLRWNGAVGPAILGTEKLMELAFLSGTLHSSTFPPHDPWLAGYSINYYYLGYVIIAALAVLGGADAAEAFNLGIATIFALAATMVAGLVVTLIEATRREQGDASLRGSPGKIAAGLLGIVLVLVAGNQMGALQKIVGSEKVVALDAGQLVDALQQRIGGAETIALGRPTPRTGEFGVISTLEPNPPTHFDWWWPSRAVWDDVGPDSRIYAITEFPFFSFYLGDMHPHVLALPFGLLALALAAATTLRPAAPQLLAHAQGRIELVLSGLILGSMYAINSWDAPTYALLYAGALALLYRRLAQDADQSFPLRAYARALAAAAGVALLLIAPFLMTFSSLAGNQPVPQPWSSIPIISTLGRLLAPVHDHTGIHAFIIIFGLFFILLLTYALSSRQRRAAEQHGAAEAQPAQPPQHEPIAGWLTAGAALLAGLLVGFPLLALLPLAIVLATQAWHAGDHPTRAFVLWTMAVGALIIFGADLVFIRDHFNNRMNTVFKFYYQAWVIWGTLAAYAAWALLQPALLRRLSTLLWPAPALLLLAGALVYPLGTLTWADPWRDGARTLNGLAYLAREAPDEAAAIAWLKQHAQPEEIVLTAVGDSYVDETGRVAAATGRQTLLGWAGSHESLWRSGSPEARAAIDERLQDVPLLYTTTDSDQARSLIARYGIDYIYVGPAERRKYAGPGLDKFGQLAERVFAQGQVQIYRLHGGGGVPELP